MLPLWDSLSNSMPHHLGKYCKLLGFWAQVPGKDNAIAYPHCLATACARLSWQQTRGAQKEQSAE